MAKTYAPITAEIAAAMSLTELRKEMKRRAAIGQTEAIAILNAEIGRQSFGDAIPAALAADLELSMSTLGRLLRENSINNGSLGFTRKGLRGDAIAFMRKVIATPGTRAKRNRKLLEDSGNGHLTFESIQAKHSHLFKEESQ